MIELPRKDDGGYYVSYSQLKLWNEIKGFSTGLPGKQEYIRSYFLGETYEDKTGFGTFGQDVEDYIVNRKGTEKFTDEERKTLETIEPLGIFQKEFKMQYDGFYLKGFIDDCSPSFDKIRDYKTASDKSRKKYEEDDYFQLDIYALSIQKEHGKLPKELEVVVIERLGNGFRGGRDVMSVGSRVWHIPRQTSSERLKMLEKYIVATTTQISDYYKIFQKLNT